MFNIADLPAVQEQLARDAAASEEQSAAPLAVLIEQDQAAPAAPPGSTYPAKTLVLKDGQYHVGNHDK